MTTIAPLQRWKRDDWVINCALRDDGGQPINLSGSVVAAELYLAGYRVFQPLTVANGGIVRTADSSGQFTVIAPRLLTAHAQSDAGATTHGDRTRIVVYLIDTLGRRQTLGAIPFEVFDGGEGLAIDEAPSAVFVSQAINIEMVVAATQGLPGPTNIGAGQIADIGALGIEILKAKDAASARALLAVAGVTRASVNDTDYSAKAADTYVAYVALTAARTVTLPPASAYQPGLPLWVADETGNCSTDHPIIVAVRGSDTLGNQPNVSLTSPYEKLAFHSNGTNLWTV